MTADESRVTTVRVSRGPASSEPRAADTSKRCRGGDNRSSRPRPRPRSWVSRVRSSIRWRLWLQTPERGWQLGAYAAVGALWALAHFVQPYTNITLL